MRLYFRNHHLDPQYEIMQKSRTYMERFEDKYVLEELLTNYIESQETGIRQVFEKYLDAVNEENVQLVEEGYLLGAEDREKMLR